MLGPMPAHRPLSTTLLAALLLLGCASNKPEETDAAGSPDASLRADAQNDQATDPGVTATDTARPADLTNTADVAIAADSVAIADSAGPADHANQADIVRPADLAGQADTARPADLASQADRTGPADLTAVPDLPPAKDTSATEVSRSDAGVGDAGHDAGCEGWTSLKRLSPAEVSNLIATTDPVIINVHVPYEGDIPGTDTSIPSNDVAAIEAYLKYDHCADVVLYCLGGNTSPSVGNALIKLGYLRVRDLEGGMKAWQAAGYPLLKDGGT
jgi:rhodanese-related sulfurtransferase